MKLSLFAALLFVLCINREAAVGAARTTTTKKSGDGDGDGDSAAETTKGIDDQVDTSKPTIHKNETEHGGHENTTKASAATPGRPAPPRNPVGPHGDTKMARGKGGSKKLVAAWMSIATGVMASVLVLAAFQKPTIP